MPVSATKSATRPLCVVCNQTRVSQYNTDDRQICFTCQTKEAQEDQETLNKLGELAKSRRRLLEEIHEQNRRSQTSASTADPLDVTLAHLKRSRIGNGSKPRKKPGCPKGKEKPLGVDLSREIWTEAAARKHYEQNRIETMRQQRFLYGLNAALMKKKTVSFQTLSRKVGRTASSLRDYGQAKHRAHVSVAQKIADVLGCTTDDLYLIEQE